MACFLRVTLSYFCDGVRVCVSTGAVEVQIPRVWTSRWLYAAAHGCWEPDSGPLLDQNVLLLVEPSLNCNFFFNKIKNMSHFPVVSEQLLKILVLFLK